MDGLMFDFFFFNYGTNRYGRKYQSSEEMKHKYSIFAPSLETIRSHNNKGLSYTLGVNEYADMTWEEFRKNKLGAAQQCSATKKGNHKLTIREVILGVGHFKVLFN
ncbi:putative cathepsin H [Helianthus anomalus]